MPDPFRLAILVIALTALGAVAVTLFSLWIYGSLPERRPARPAPRTVIPASRSRTHLRS